MQINRKDTEGKWVEYNENVKFKLRPIPFSMLDLQALGGQENMLRLFMYGLVDWSGLKEGQKKFEVTDDNKQYIYDFHFKMRDWIYEEIEKLNLALSGQAGN